MKQPLDKAALKRRRDGIVPTLALLVVAALVFLGVRAQRSVTEIGDRAFEGCHDLSSVTLPDGIQVIRSLTFDGCSSLESIVSPTASPSSRPARFPAARSWPASPWAAALKRWKRTPSGAVRR